MLAIICQFILFVNIVTKISFSEKILFLNTLYTCKKCKNPQKGLLKGLLPKFTINSHHIGDTLILYLFFIAKLKTALFKTAFVVRAICYILYIWIE
jgi:hypothetical protein